VFLLACEGGERAQVQTAAGQAFAHSAGPPVTGDWLLLHSLSDPEQLNPLTSNDAAASAILQHVFQSLLTRDPRSLELKPLIAAARPAISDDKLSYTFTLRRDVRFQDGRPLTGEDVLFSIKAIKCPLVNAPFLRVYFDSVVDARLLDPYTIRFTIKEPYFLNESVLGGIDILPRHYYDPENLLQGVTLADLQRPEDRLPPEVKKFADNFNRNYSRNPMGSGPYRFHSWKTGREIELVRNPDYWGNGKEGIEQPYLDRYKYQIVNNPDAALVRMKSGSLDVMGLTPIQHVRGTGSERFHNHFQKYEYFSANYSYIGWNNNHPIFRDKRVRKAMTYFTNRRQMVKTILFGLGEVVESPIYFFRPEYDKSLPSYPFDPQKGLELLREAGWRDSDGDGVLDKVIDGRTVPFVFEIKINSGNTTRKSVALTLQDELRKHGIAASVRELDWTIFLADVKNRQFDAVILGWAMSVNEPDAYQVWHSSQAANRGSNHIGYKNERVDRILEAYRREFDPQKRIAMYREFQRILSDEQPYTFLFVNKSVVAVHRRIHGVEVFPEGLRTIDWWVPAALQKYREQPVS
ncbi:MAG TPA: peptide-binding protein, partial [Candidatus Eisenbacteria bacterium]|nr:peptide-binding protein [Candidatus Eisenbacteria bacterium]